MKTSLRNHLPGFVKQSLKRACESLWDLKERPRLRGYGDELDAIVEREGKDREIIVFLPSVQWDITLFQRPQQLAKAFSRRGSLVFYLEPTLSKARPGVQRLRERLYLCRVPSAALCRLHNPVVVTQAWNCRQIRFLDSPRIVYDYIDHLSVFPFNQSRLRRRHEALVRSAHRVLATAQDLYQEVARVRPDCLYCPNGVEYEHFASCKGGGENARVKVGLADILDGKPIVGYYGAVARWFDYALFRKVARLRRDVGFLLIGMEWDATLSRSDILREPNIDYIGSVPYSELPDYLSFFNVATIPFVLNALTHATSPLKLFEYMAGGKPVVVTPMRECLQYPGVLAAADEKEFSTSIDRALELSSDPEYLSVIDRVAKRNTWETRAQKILDSLTV